MKAILFLLIDLLKEIVYNNLRNGDYYFFIDVNFHFGYLGHPWQQKVWIYGKKLIEEFKKADLKGFKLIEEKN